MRYTLPFPISRHLTLAINTGITLKMAV